MSDSISTPDTKVKVNVGCGRNILPGWVNIDRPYNAEADIGQNLDVPLTPWDHISELPIKDNIVDEFLLSHTLEHIHNTLGLMQELHRIAKPGAKMIVRCPYGSSDDAWEDPTHVRAYFLGSFGYFGQPNYWQADYGYRGDWQVKKITLLIPQDIEPAIVISPNELKHRILTARNIITEMIAELYAVKPIREPRRELQEPPEVFISS